ncbi:hypothetical protein J4Q44_G00164320 [Coregonus suidteri]|uniref:Uncharacterized protein n=1 Tax=Coregonus suidteri TaxID=861788 RepID=A0AAN8QR23_9TELE
MPMRASGRKRALLYRSLAGKRIIRPFTVVSSECQPENEVSGLTGTTELSKHKDDYHHHSYKHGEDSPGQERNKHIGIDPITY